MGCTTPKKQAPEGVSYKTWSSRATIQDLIHKKNHSVSIDLFMANQEKLRMEISGLLSTNIASILIDSQSTQYCIYPRKQCYMGNTTDQAFRPLFSFTLNPQDFFKILQGEPMTTSDWICDLSESKFLKCENTKKKILIRTEFLKNGQKTVDISSPQFAMSWLLESPQTEVQLEDKIFILQIPKNYSKSSL